MIEIYAKIYYHKRPATSARIPGNTIACDLIPAAEASSSDAPSISSPTGSAVASTGSAVAATGSAVAATGSAVAATGAAVASTGAAVASTSSKEPHLLFGKHDAQNGRANWQSSVDIDPSSSQATVWSKQGPASAQAAKAGPQVSLSTNMALSSIGRASVEPHLLLGKHGLQGRASWQSSITDPSSKHAPEVWSKQGLASAQPTKSSPQISLSTNMALSSTGGASVAPHLLFGKHVWQKAKASSQSAKVMFPSSRQAPAV
jgi:uncharacterized membrane protein